MLNRVGLIARGLAAALLVLVSARLAAADERRLPVPAVAIRAGDLIRDDMITERAFAPNVLGVAMFFEGRQVLVGRMARRALLPGQPIPTNPYNNHPIILVPQDVLRDLPLALGRLRLSTQSAMAIAIAIESGTVAMA